MEPKKLLTTLILVAVVLIAGCKKDNYKATTGVCPAVISTSPINAEAGVLLSKVITATFNEKMNPLTIDQTSFSVGSSAKGADAVAGAVTYTDSTATFTPSGSLSPGKTYTGTIKSSVKDLKGNFMQADYVWNFNTGISPTVTSTDPLNVATGVVLNKVVNATFSVAMDPLTLTATTFTLKLGATPVAGTVSYTGTTASFTPSIALIPNTIYTGTITTGAKNATGIPLANNYIWTFNTLAIAPPTMISTEPANNATDVVLNKIIMATFSVPMDPTTLTATSFTLKQGVTSVAGAISYAGSTASFTPSAALLAGTTYTATVTTGAKSVAGIAMANDYVWTFTTGIITAPSVISTDPANNAAGVLLNKVVTATFSVPMDATTLTATTFTLKIGVTSVAGAITYSGTTASFTPSSALLSGTTYTATITTGAKNVPGIALASDYVWTFTTVIIAPPTVISTDPAINATSVALNKVVTATFSVPMDATTLTGTTFTLKIGVTSVAGAVTYSGTTASFTPSAALLAGTTYTATITTGVKNVPGTALASDYVWTFTTLLTPAPTIITIDPGNNATNVPLNKVIKATFDMPMDATTLTGTTFTLKLGVTSIAGAVTYSGSIASFTPTNVLYSGSTYTATITTGAKNTGGIPLASDYVWTFNTIAPLGPGPVNLGTAADFAAIGKSGISTTGVTSITGDIGVSPVAATSITGFGLIMDISNQFSTTPIVSGKVYASDYAVPTPAKMTTAVSDMETALTTAMGMTTTVINELGAGNISGMTLAPGLYKWTTGLLITNAGVTLAGGPNDTWVFQISQDLTVNNSAIVTLTGGALAKNIFWVTNTQATLGTSADFSGNILSKTLISLNSLAKVTGRLLAQTAVTFNAGTLIKP